jgi:hypothetical protein
LPIREGGYDCRTGYNMLTPRPPDVHVNKVYRVTTIARVAAELGEDEDWFSDIAGEMEPEDGLIWVYAPGDEETMPHQPHRYPSRSDRLISYTAKPKPLRSSPDGYHESGSPPKLLNFVSPMMNSGRVPWPGRRTRHQYANVITANRDGRR